MTIASIKVIFNRNEIGKMTITQINNETKRQGYLEKVERFYRQVQDWIHNDFDFALTENCPILDTIGTYPVEVLSIRRKNTPEPTLADLFPQGIAVFMGEGLIELKGIFGTEWIIYMLKDGIIIGNEYDKVMHIYKGIEKDGWYWLEESEETKPHLMNKALFFNLLSLVSDYDS